MSQTNIYITDESEEKLQELKKVAVNNALGHSKAVIINMAIDIATKTVEKLDDQSFQQVTNLKK